MPLDDEKVVDVAITLWQGAAQRRSNRQGFEWRLAFGLWAGLLAAAKILSDYHADAKRLFSLSPTWALVAILVAGGSVIGTHAVWIAFYVSQRNLADAQRGIELEAVISERCGLPFVRPIPSRFDPAQFVEIALTVILVALASAFAWPALVG